MDLIRNVDYIPADSIDCIEDVPILDASLRLYSPMKLRCDGVGHEVFSPSPMTIGQVTIWSASPIRVIRHVLPGRTIIIEPASSLGTNFAIGWMKLPVEVKEQILAHNLVSAIPKGHIEYDTCYAPWDFGVLLHHLRCTPEIAALSREIYYKRNVFLLEPEGVDGYNAVPYNLMYPGPAVGHLVRFIEFKCKLGTRAVQKLEGLSQRQYGFPNLKYLKLTLDASLCLGGDRADFRQWLHRIIAGGVDFHCKGEMEVVGEVTRRILQDGRSRTFRYLPPEDADQLHMIESILRPLLRFDCD